MPSSNPFRNSETIVLFGANWDKLDAALATSKGLTFTKEMYPEFHTSLRDFMHYHSQRMFKATSAMGLEYSKKQLHALWNLCCYTEFKEGDDGHQCEWFKHMQADIACLQFVEKVYQPVSAFEAWGTDLPARIEADVAVGKGRRALQSLCMVGRMVGKV